jgi:hypothetical protein
MKSDPATRLQLTKRGSKGEAGGAGSEALWRFEFSDLLVFAAPLGAHVCTLSRRLPNAAGWKPRGGGLGVTQAPGSLADFIARSGVIGRLRGTRMGGRP